MTSVPAAAALLGTPPGQQRRRQLQHALPPARRHVRMRYDSRRRRPSSQGIHCAAKPPVAGARAPSRPRPRCPVEMRAPMRPLRAPSSLIITAPAAPSVDSALTCPFCGGRAHRVRPILAWARLGVTVGGTGGFLDIRRPESYLRCHGCTMEFVRADRDVGNILAGLRVERRVAGRVRHYYGEGVTASDLLARHRTAMARRASRCRSLASVSVSRKELFVCFRRGGVRTFGSFVKRSSGDGEYYVFTELSMA